eukprot:4247749-Lingulodinium_polyedra.AAC.1
MRWSARSDTGFAGASSTALGGQSDSGNGTWSLCAGAWNRRALQSSTTRTLPKHANWCDSL